MKPYKTIRVRVTKQQHDIIVNKAQYYGHKTISSFIRDAILKDIYYQKMLREIHQKVFEKQ